MDFELLGKIRAHRTIASGRGIRVLATLNRRYGKGNWRKMKGIATDRLADGTVAEAEVHWFEAHGIGRRKNQDQTVDRIDMPKATKRFAVCIRNDEYEESLELRKIYEVIEDSVAQKHDMLRIVDEEGEDYLYPRDWFLPIELPRKIEEAILELTHQ